jgi:hypothetical protein
MDLSIKSEMLVSGKRSKPLEDVHMFVADDHWQAIKKLARRQDITASELVRRLIAAELAKAAKVPTEKRGIVAPF